MNKQYTVPTGSTPGSGGGGGGSGTVTSVGLSVNSGASSGIFTVTGSPVTTAGTLNANLAGTSGGVTYFSSGAVLSSSGALTNNAVVLGGGAGAAPKTVAGITTDGVSQLTLGVATSSTGALNLTGATSGTATITAQAAANTPTLTLPNASGTFAVTASSPIVLNTTTGNLTAPTAVTSAASLTSNAVVLGGGGQATSTQTFITTNGSTTLTVGVIGGGNGVLALAGNTSGTATLTAPAVAGTVTNAVVSSNALSIPPGTVGVGTSIVNSSSATTGINLGANVVDLVAGNAVQWHVSSSFNTTTPPIADAATGNNQITWGAGIISTTGSANPLFYPTSNVTRVTSDITLSTSATNIASFTLPALAKAWAFRADIMWVVSAGTTPTLSIGVNLSQTPTGTTNGAGNILTSNADVGVDGSSPISASGATNLVTTGTLTPAGTVFQASCFGTILASATAGTFAITMTGTGSGFAGVAKAGTACYLF
jgi:fibronectin-binding autotransporter adhesin